MVLGCLFGGGFKVILFNFYEILIEFKKDFHQVLKSCQGVGDSRVSGGFPRNLRRVRTSFFSGELRKFFKRFFKWSSRDFQGFFFPLKFSRVS